MKRLFKSSIARRFLGSFLIVLVPLIIISLTVNFLSLKITQQQVITSYKNSLALLSKQFTNNLTKITNDLNAFNYTSNAPNNIWEFFILLEKMRFFANINDLDNITIYFQGQKRKISSRYGLYNFQEIELKRLTEIASNQKWQLRELHNNKKTLTYVKKMKDALFSEDITIKIDISEIQIKDRIDNLKIQGGGNIFLIDFLGDSIFGRNYNNINKEKLMKNVDNYSDNVGQFVYQEYKKRFRVLYNKSNLTGITLVMYLPETILMEPIVKIRKWIYLIMIVFFSLAVIFTYINYQNLLVPIHTLIDGMKRVRAGDFEVILPEDETEEFGFMHSQFNRMVRQIKTMINEVYMEHLKYQQAQLNFLQSQINPHFLYNCLNFIYQMAKGKKVDAAAKMSLYLGQYFRYATRSNKNMVTIKEEIDNINTYLKIQQMRYPNKIEYTVNIENELWKFMIPRLIIQPIVENAIIHGLETVDRKGRLIITAYKKRLNEVIVEVEDNGKGIRPDKLTEINKKLSDVNTEDSGYGLKNPHLRLKLRFGDKAGIILQSKEQGTKVILKIPINDRGDWNV